MVGVVWMVDRRAGPTDWDYSTNLNNSSSGNKDTAIRHMAVDDGLGTILGTAANPLSVTVAAGGGGAVTIADGADVAEGATTATSYSDATGASAGTLVALGKGNYVLTAAMSAKLPLSLGAKPAANSLSVAWATDTTLPAGTAVIGKVGIDQTTPGTTNLVAAGQNGAWNITNVSGTVSLPTGASTAVKQPALGTAGAASTDVITVQGIASGTPLIIGGIVASGVTDSGNPVKTGGYASTTPPTAVTAGQRVNAWYSLNGASFTSVVGPQLAGDASVSGSNAAGMVNSSGTTSIPAAAMFGFDGTNYARMRGDTNGAVNQPYAMTGSRWQYAAATSGIVNSTTAVTIAAAAGASVRNYLPSFQLDWDALGVATEIAIRDGAAGTVIWRGKIPAGVAGMREVTPLVPLKGTANTLMEFVTLTASVTGGVFFNGQGFTGT